MYLGYVLWYAYPASWLSLWWQVLSEMWEYLWGARYILNFSILVGVILAVLLHSIILHSANIGKFLGTIRASIQRIIWSVSSGVHLTRKGSIFGVLMNHLFHYLRNMGCIRRGYHCFPKYNFTISIVHLICRLLFSAMARSHLNYV